MFCVQTLFCKVHCVTVHHVNVQQQVRQPERIFRLDSCSLMQMELYTPMSGFDRRCSKSRHVLILRIFF